MQDNELILFDRLNVIKDVVNKYGEDNFYIAFSGGKDSTVLHHLVDIALPNNNIPRVFANTGIEYQKIVDFVKVLSESDKRFVFVTPNKPIKETLERVGYPFKSKEHSLRVQQFNEGKNSNFIYKYIYGVNKDGSSLMGSRFICPKILKYQFDVRGRYNYSNLCCYELKKKPMTTWSRLNGRSIVITGMLSEEGGSRARLSCVINDSKGRLIRFHPLIKVNKEFENWFIEKFNIRLCDLYYPPFNFLRTGCKGCPFALTLSEQLEVMGRLLPAERKQCEFIWKPVYDEYRRLGYRLPKIEQIKLF